MSNSKIDPQKYPNIVLIENAFNQNYRFAAKSIDRCLGLFGERWLRQFEKPLNPFSHRGTFAVCG